MAKLGGTKLTWVIKNFSSLKSETLYSVPNEIGTTGYFCCLGAVCCGVKHEDLSVHIFYGPSLPIEQKRCLKYRLTIVNQLSEELSIITEKYIIQCLLTVEMNVAEGIQFVYPLTMEHFSGSVFYFPNFHVKDSAFLVNDEVKIVVEVDVLEDVPVETEMANKSLASTSIHVNEFKVFPSQVESVKRIFEKHPDIAVDFRAKNQHVRSACMSSLLGLVETLCKSLHELSNEDLIEADIALKHVKEAGFKVDWLEKNLEQVKAKKMKQLSDLATLQETEEKALNLKRKFEELDALAEEQKKTLSATRTSLSFDDVV
ncbi:hypothetical protein N665_0538s0037 [Sinapis alba]|nr:hypothetical protein N665_0538s0037 [Sinapis alba]